MLTVKELEKLSRRELRARADEVFKDAETRGPGYLIGAQFYIGELERRADSRTSIRDLILEILVIILIAGELYMSHKQSIQQDTQFKEQQIVLGNMEKSSKETLGAITAERQTMEAMNTALQKQLALFYDVSLNMVFDQDKKELMLMNNGRTNVVLWGGKVGEERAFAAEEGRTITSGAGFKFEGSLSYELMIARFPKPAQGLLPYELYIKNERGEEFVQHGYFGVVWQNDVGILNVQTISVAPEHWSRTIKKTSK
jgi:hypothetical protein